MNTATTSTAASLKNALKIVEPAVHKRSSIAALAHVRIGRGRIESTDMEATIDAPLAASDHLPYMLVRFDDLKRLASALKVKDEFSFDVADGSLRVHSRLGVTDIPVGCIEDWPELTLGESVAQARFADPVAARKAVIDTCVARSHDESRPVLCGMMMERSGEDALRISACDSCRLAIDSVVTDHIIWNPGERTSQGLRIIVPRADDFVKNLSGVSHIEVFNPSDDSVSGGSYAMFCDASSGVVVTVRLVDGIFPNIDQLVTDAWENEFPVPAGMVEAVKTAAKITNARDVPVRIGVSSGFEMSVSLARQDGPTHRTTLDIPTPARIEYDTTIGANCGFLVDGLKFVCDAGDDHADMRTISPLRPMLFTGGSRTYLLMPVRLPSQD